MIIKLYNIMAFKIKTEKGLRTERSHAPTCIPAFFQSHCMPLLAIYIVSMQKHMPIFTFLHVYMYIYIVIYVYIIYA